jgi:hypothetical protein
VGDFLGPFDVPSVELSWVDGARIYGVGSVRDEGAAFTFFVFVVSLWMSGRADSLLVDGCRTRQLPIRVPFQEAHFLRWLLRSFGRKPFDPRLEGAFHDLLFGLLLLPFFALLLPTQLHSLYLSASHTWARSYIFVLLPSDGGI